MSGSGMFALPQAIYCEAIRFAKQVGDHLRAACNAGRCNQLLLVAGPDFIGLLKEQLGSLAQVTVTEIVKNLGQHDSREIRTHLPERL